MTTRVEQRRRTRAKLIEAFFELNASRPIEKITVADIVAIAHCHRTTFYEYFMDVYDLRAQEEKDLLDLQRQRIVEAAERGELSVLDTQALVSKVREIFDERGQRIMVLLGEYGDSAFRQQLYGNFVEGLSSTMHLDPNNVHDAYLMEFLVAGLFGVVNRLNHRQDIEFLDLFTSLHPVIASALESMSKA